MNTSGVVGLDLSLRATGLAFIPADWACDFSRVRVGHFGQELRKDASEALRMERVRYIRDRVLEFVQRCGSPAVFIEQYAFTSQTGHAHAAGELGGAVKLALHQQAFLIHVVAPASARKLLGKAPRKDAKVWTQAQVYKMGAPRVWTGDELDAFVVANYGATEVGVPALIARAA